MSKTEILRDRAGRITGTSDDKPSTEDLAKLSGVIAGVGEELQSAREQMQALAASVKGGARNAPEFERLQARISELSELMRASASRKSISTALPSASAPSPEALLEWRADAILEPFYIADDQLILPPDPVDPPDSPLWTGWLDLTEVRRACHRFGVACVGTIYYRRIASSTTGRHHYQNDRHDLFVNASPRPTVALANRTLLHEILHCSQAERYSSQVQWTQAYAAHPELAEAECLWAEVAVPLQIAIPDNAPGATRACP